MASGAEIHPDYALADVAIGARNLSIIAWLGAASQAFFFVAFLFAFFYLRALNTNGRWNTHHVHPSRAYGVAILICVLASIAAAGLAAWSPTRSPNALVWRGGLGGAILLALAAIGVQAAQYADLGFGPGDGSFTSVFVGWTGLLVANFLAVTYWLTSTLAESLRRDGRSVTLLRPSAQALALYWAVLGLVEVVAFILLYFVG